MSYGKGMRRADRAVTDRSRLESMLAAADSCRLGFAVGGEPYVVALSFGHEWRGDLPVLYFHCAREGRKLEMMRANPRACLQLDCRRETTAAAEPCGWSMLYESIVGYGILEEVEDEAERRAGLDLVMRHYGWDGTGSYAEKALAATAVLRLNVSELSGKARG
jgi:uncharacterized protein